MSPRRARHTPVPGVRAYQRGNTWWYRIELEPDPLTGERRFDYQGGFESEDAAWAAAVITKRNLDDGIAVPRDQRTVGAFFSEWLTAVRHELKPSAYQTYVDLVEAYVLPWLGPRRMREVDTPMVNALYVRLLTEGRAKPDNDSVMYTFWKAERDAGREPGPTRIAKECEVTIHAARKAVGRYRNGRVPAPKPPGLAPKTVRNVHRVLLRAFRDAVAWKYLGLNPAAHASLPRTPTQRRRRRHNTWTPQQLSAWLQVALNDRYAALWLLAATTGMRRSELAGVEIDLLDLDGGLLTIEDTRVIVAGRAEDSDGKTESGRRTISLDRATVKQLRLFLRRIRAEQATSGDDYPSHRKLFRYEDGQMINPDTITRMFNRLVDKAGVPKIRLHDVRHTYATISIDHGVDPKILSDRLGHSSVAFTLQTYVNRTTGRDRGAADAIAGLILGNPEDGDDQDDEDDGLAGSLARRH